MFTCSKGNTVVTVHTCTYEKYIELSKKGQIFEGGGGGGVESSNEAVPRRA